MSSYIKELNNVRNGLIQGYFDSLNDKEKYKYLELKAIIIFQKYIRRFLCRKRFLLLKSQSLEVQKAFRGYLARDNHKKEFEVQNDNIMTQFYEFHISIIQKHWRGYKWRKINMDYQAKKQWLETTRTKNEETLVKMREIIAKKKSNLQLKFEEEQKNNFFNIAYRAHHLVSTKAIPGVYNNPYLPPELKPKVYNTDIEEYLRTVIKNKHIKNKKRNFKSIINTISNNNTYRSNKPKHQYNYFRRTIQYQ